MKPKQSCVRTADMSVHISVHNCGTQYRTNLLW